MRRRRLLTLGLTFPRVAQSMTIERLRVPQSYACVAAPLSCGWCFGAMSLPERFLVRPDAPDALDLVDVEGEPKGDSKPAKQQAHHRKKDAIDLDD